MDDGDSDELQEILEPRLFLLARIGETEAQSGEGTRPGTQRVWAGWPFWQCHQG